MTEEFNLDNIRRQILPRSASDVYRNRLRYLVAKDLSSLKPALHTRVIKEMFRKFSQKWEIDLDKLDEIIDSANVLEVTSMLKVLCDVQKDLKVKNLQLGVIFYDAEKKCFRYFNFKSYALLKK